MNTAVALPFTGHNLPAPARLNVRRGVPSAQAVRAQLARILESDGFVHAKRMRRFLEFVVEETLAGRASQVCEYSIGISVFERSESFEPGLDPIVRNDARRLRQKLLEYYLQEQGRDDGEMVKIDMPKGSYVPVFKSGSNAEATDKRGQFRLSISLIRIVDGSQVWNSEYEFQITEGLDERRLCIALSSGGAVTPGSRSVKRLRVMK